MTVWFQDEKEAERLLTAGKPFVVALSHKRPDGASANDIKRLFEVAPVEVVPPDPGTRSGLRCNIIGKVPAP